MNYSTLIQTVQDWTENTNDVFVANIPTFIENACRTIAKEVDSVGLNATATISTASLSPLVPLPTDCFVIKSVTKTSAGRAKPLYPRPYDLCVYMWPDRASAGGNPNYYNRIDSQSIYVVPTPTSIQPLEVRYVTVTIPTSANPDTYLLTNYPNLVLYKVMTEANLFQMDNENVTLYQTFYDREREAVANEARRNRQDDTTPTNPLNTTVHQNTLKGDA